MFGPRLQQGHITDRIEGAVFYGRLPPNQGGSLFRIAHDFHDLLPGSRAHIGVGCRQVGACNLEVESGLQFRFVFGPEQALRLDFDFRFQARLRSGDFVFEVKDSPWSTDQSESFFHCFAHVASVKQPALDAVSVQRASDDRAEAKL